MEAFMVSGRTSARRSIDDLKDAEPEKTFGFVRDCAVAVIPSYLPLGECLGSVCWRG
ncbi:hypothetical protein E2C01_076220 [Portunus trituberculatus]|uniref:Uncharacterized protein n=1 Tax=Portunus trituberculatus TaxID=210409 RepID=A0A5B7IHA1_PORTR|nr:hypothetical protein [Portunus trituberculatus]